MAPPNQLGGYPPHHRGSPGRRQAGSEKEVIRTLRNPDRRPGYKLIFRPYIRFKNGKVIYARNYGLRAFPIWVKE